jgi:hypothetical protein
MAPAMKPRKTRINADGMFSSYLVVAWLAC